MTGSDIVNVTRKGSSASSKRRIPFKAQKRVEPNQAPARSGQPPCLKGDTFPGRAIEPVCEQKNGGILAKHPSGPKFIETMQAFSDPRPA
jgi:hypothetical protein